MRLFKKKKQDDSKKYYDSIDNLILYNFDRYMVTKDNNWFIVGYTGKEKKIESEIIKKIEDNILDEYFKAVDDVSFSRKIQTWAKIDNLITKYTIVSELIKIFSMGFDLSIEGQDMRYRYVDMLGRFGFKVPVLNSPSGDLEECNKVINLLQGIRTQISLLQSSIKETYKSEKTSLQRNLKIAEISLGINYRLDPKKITVSEWVEISKLMQEKAKKN